MLRSPQSSSAAFVRHKDDCWAIEHDFIESSFSSTYSLIYSFLSAPESRRNLILSQREPLVDNTLTLKGDYGSNFNDLMLRVKQARDLYMIIGPPGTGKTSFGLLNTLREELLEANSTVLLIAYTNRAVDEICSKLIDADIDFVRLGSLYSCDKTLRRYLLSERIKESATLERARRFVADVRVFVATSAAINGNIELLKLKHFSLAIIDEASQLLEPQLLGILSACDRGRLAIERFVMIGDHKQLPAVVAQSREDSVVHESELREIGLTDCRVSLFERLVRRYYNDESVCTVLSRQGRMHEDIADFVNKEFYNGVLSVVPLAHQTQSLPFQEHNGHSLLGSAIFSHRLLFVNVAPKQGEALSDKVNVAEAQVIADAVGEIFIKENNTFHVESTIGVIVPYRNQIATVRRLLASKFEGVNNDLQQITIDTVERFQGGQRDYIIYGFTVSKPYQLDFLTENTFTDADGSVVDRKLNVAITRARRHLILVGNISLLSRCRVLSRLTEYCRIRDCVFDTSTN